MSKNDLKKIPLPELQKDLVDTAHDIEVCELAISQGINGYTGKDGNYNDVVQRLEINKRIKEVIEKEIASRA